MLKILIIDLSIVEFSIDKLSMIGLLIFKMSIVVKIKAVISNKLKV